MDEGRVVDVRVLSWREKGVERYCRKQLKRRTAEGNKMVKEGDRAESYA